MTRRYVLDSGPAFDYLFERHGVAGRVKELLRRGAKIGLCTPVLGEVLGGLENSSSRDESWAIADRQLRRLACWPYDKAAAYKYGRLYADLRKMGRPIGQIDLQLAAVALTLGDCTVVTTDSDLSAVPGLHVENWRT